MKRNIWVKYFPKLFVTYKDNIWPKKFHIVKDIGCVGNRFFLSKTIMIENK